MSINEFDYIWGYFYLSNILIKQSTSEDKYNEGMKILEKAFEKNKKPQYFEISKKYCEELVKKNDSTYIEKAVVILNKLAELYPEKVEIYYILSKAYEKQNDIKKTIEILEKANKHREFFINPDYLLSLGLAYEKNKEIKNAIEIFKTILNRNKEHIPSLTHLGRILLNLKKDKRALKYLNFALTLDDNNVIANFGVGKILQEDEVEDRNKNLLVALKHYQKVLSVDPKNHR